MSKILVFFGVPGSGKSYIAKELASHFGAIFYEADDDYTHEMREQSKISGDTKRSTNRTFYEKVIEKGKDLAKPNDLVFVASALGTEENRQQFVKAFGKNVHFILVNPNKEKHLHQTLERELSDSHDSKENLAKKLRVHLEKKYRSFDEPAGEYIEIRNDYDDFSVRGAKEQV